MLIMEDENAPDMRRFYLGHAQVNRAARSPRRCLFGPADPQVSQRFVQDEMRTIYEGQKKKWNFDFELEQPLLGRYQWESVAANLPPEQSRTEAGFGPDVEAVLGAKNEVDPGARPAAVAPAAATPGVPPFRQRLLTDILATRKRPSASRPASSDATRPSKRTASSDGEQPPALL